jgi:CelD/BcsL family acetyltransferase involved in cellulose biosynthesis
MNVLSSQSISVSRVSHVSQWDALSDQFDRLAGAEFMRQHSWLRSWWSVYGGVGRELFLLHVVRGDDTIGMLPLYRQQVTVGGQLLRHLGTGKICTDNLSILASSDDAEVVGGAIVDYLTSESVVGQWDFIELDGVQADCSAMQSLAESYESKTKISVDRFDGPSYWRLPIDGGWVGFLERRSKRTRRLFRTSDRDYLQSGRARLDIATDWDSAECLLSATARLHQSRWADRGVAGCFDSAGFTEFLALATTELWKSGQLYVAGLWMDDQVVAGVVGAVSGDRMFLYLVGMDNDFAEHRPGLLLNLATIQYAASIGCRSVDLMRGDEEYKARLGAMAIPQGTWRLTAPRRSSQLRDCVWKTGTAIKGWMKESLVSAPGSTQP